MANKPNKSKSVLVTGSAWPMRWATGSTIQEARKRAGIKKMEQYSVLVFNHEHWAVKDYGGSTWAPDTEPPVHMSFYKGEMTALTLCGRGEQRDGWALDVDVIVQPEADAPERDRTKGVVVQRHNASKYVLNDDYVGAPGQEIWLEKDRQAKR